MKLARAICRISQDYFNRTFRFGFSFFFSYCVAIMTTYTGLQERITLQSIGPINAPLASSAVCKKVL